jgi:hypothetical protein
MACAHGLGMPEVSVGLGLERFTLVAQGEVYCTVDIVEQQTASIVLTALPDFPLEIQADIARQFVAAWQQRGELAGQSYEVRHEQRAI